MGSSFFESRYGESMDVHPNEFVSVRNLGRSIGLYLDDLVSGRKSKLVILHRNQPKAVIVNIETFERLSNSEKRLLEEHPQRVTYTK